MSTYAELRARIEEDINRSDLTTRVQSEIKAAIKHYSHTPFWFNEGSTTLTASSSASFLTVPADFITLVDLYINIGGYPVRLEQKPLNEIVEYRDASGSQPTAFAYYQDRLELDCPVNQQYTFPTYYIKELATLSASTDSNAWTIWGEDLVVARAEKVLYRDVLKDQNKALLAAASEREAKMQLMGARDQRLGTGQAKAWGY